ncbi:hypothetical protein LTR10_016629 [Elasticomyces elasticus]|uniref:F-box domain-containing protein n=1 Tax=Exophiala sideris TaxID=1016849 RepID=A0ABR0JJP4_9EURO|nr:hypothetical protein LTR10_016629 [Elasticomyces elasticus]KAK5035274.1 hypothetical protein LTS07_002710 [Exophiala sideris]KAK5039373.1 hypothetical protein LTR13_003630 [Exophiala sideris]KAK5066198.1 hypothetical protein LTR69_002716 [Exophiala sideris]KAK5186875.1 hypothetical protein LTR44_000881 [Eurotiomycetes sp. CCFEE 6388]
MASPTNIVDLEIEILADIFAYVDDTSPETTRAIILVNQYFHDAVHLVQYRHRTLKWCHDRGTFVNPLGRRPKDLNSPASLRGLRHLTISKGQAGSASGGPTVSRAVDQLRDLLSHATNLKSLTWNNGYLPPSEVVRVLEEYHPQCQLKAYCDRKPTNPLTAPNADMALARSPCLTTFEMHNKHDTHSAENGHRIFQIVVNKAPNLRLASLTPFGINAPQMERWKSRWPESKPSTSLRHFSLDGWPVTAQTLDYWSRYIDIALLETFKCTRGPLHASYFVKAADVLRSLKNVSLNLSPWSCPPETAQAVEHYIATCNPLWTLSLWSWRGKVSLDTILQQHGPTLRDLQLHMREEEMDEEPSRPFSIHELQHIRRACPMLKSFTLDLDRVSSELKTEDYQETLNELKLFNLDELQVYLDCGLAYMQQGALEHIDDEYPEGDVEDFDFEDLDGEHAIQRANDCGGTFDQDDLSPTTIVRAFHGGQTKLTLHPPSNTRDIERFVGEVWKHVFGDRVTGPRQVHLKFGEWERKEMPLVFRPDGAAQKDLRVWAKARPHDRDDKKGECEIEIQCCQGKHWRKFTTDY